ncbi:MAG: serine--tRNA ligase [Candidatus Micrarchaeota archaeon]|nr:serine--tRNA ligase [Candidatus Micrarchaeota archaeon]
MITTRYVRDNLDAIRASLAKRGSDYPLDELLKADAEWRAMKTRLQELQAQRNKASLEISEMKKKGGEIKASVEALAALKAELTDMEAKIPVYEERIANLLWRMPNILHESVPAGKSDRDNPVIRSWGGIRNKTTPTHEEILGKLGLIDIERAAKISGARFYFLKGDLALLEQALIRFVADEMTRKGYTFISPPYMMRGKYYRAAVDLAQFEDALYRIADTKEALEREDYERLDEDLYLIATAEHVIAAMHAEEVFNGKDLPIRYAALSPCFRREAGSHGKDTKGIFRVHQFNKIEQFIFSRKEDTWKHFEEMQANAEGIVQRLGLPYRVVEICAGDMGARGAKSYDIEVYMPSSGEYRELTSCSNFTDWQSMRLDIKYDEAGERQYVHALNATAIPTSRALVFIAENYLNSDGSITVPEALVPYMGKSRIG